MNKPSAKIFFDSSTHARAWEFLRTAINSEEPAILVTGNYGVGKTVLCLKLVEQLKQDDHPYVYVSTPMQSYQEVLWGICSALKIKGVAAASEEDDLHRAIYKYLDKSPDTKLLIIVDDVQEHNSKTLNKIRLLSNYTQDGKYSIRLFLFGSPAFVTRLKAVDMEPLDQRIKRRFDVTGLDFEDTKEYIYFRLIHAGAKGSPFFTDDAIQRIVSATDGILRKTNNLCDMCLQIGASRGIEDIDVDLVNESLLALGWELKDTKPEATEEPSTVLPAPAPAVTASVTAAPLSPAAVVHPQVQTPAAIPPESLANESGVGPSIRIHSESGQGFMGQSGAGQQSPFEPNRHGGMNSGMPPLNTASGYHAGSGNMSAATGNPFHQPGSVPMGHMQQNSQSTGFGGSHVAHHDTDKEIAPPKPAESRWTSWLFRGAVVLLLIAIFAAVVLRDTNVAG
nr:AAA family ATPase [Oceanobacter mangrovi]